MYLLSWLKGFILLECVIVSVRAADFNQNFNNLVNHNHYSNVIRIMRNDKKRYIEQEIVNDLNTYNLVAKFVKCNYFRLFISLS